MNEKYNIKNIKELEAILSRQGWGVKKENSGKIIIKKTYEYYYESDESDRIEETKKIIIEEKTWTNERVEEIINIIKDYYTYYDPEREIMNYIKQHNINMWSEAQKVAKLFFKINRSLYNLQLYLTKYDKKLIQVSETLLYKKLIDNRKMKNLSPYELLLLLQELDKTNIYTEIREYDINEYRKLKEEKIILNSSKIEEDNKGLTISKMNFNFRDKYRVDINKENDKIIISNNYEYSNHSIIEKIYNLKLYNR